MAKAILGFAFGHINGEPGISNEDMAEYAVRHWDEYAHHSFQIEITKAVRSIGKEPDHQIVGIALKQKYSRDSPMIVKGHLDGLMAKGFNLSSVEYDVLCKEEHWSGCKWFLQKELVARGVLSPTIIRVPAVVRFDRESTQWWTRSSLLLLGYRVIRGFESILRGEIRLRDIINHFVNIK
jgi:hypothetical protein